MPTTEAPSCCQFMQEHLERGDLHLHYDPKLREYGIRYADDNTSIQVIHYCPWCGTGLPSSLRREWFDALDALGIDPDADVPSIYATDEWWRRRGNDS